MPAQVGLYVAAGRALAKSYLEWRRAVGENPAVAILNDAVEAAEEFALGVTSSMDLDLLRAIEAETPDEPTDTELFTAAQDCWICIDTAVRSALGEFNPADSAWYLLEPMFQATSERLFGFTDVGSRAQVESEQVALADERLAAAVDAVESAISMLGEQSLDRVVLDSVAATLDPLNPRP